MRNFFLLPELTSRLLSSGAKWTFVKLVVLASGALGITACESITHVSFKVSPNLQLPSNPVIPVQGYPVIPFQSPDWVGIIGTGQSLSIGAGAGTTPNVSAANPRYANIQLADTSGNYDATQPTASTLVIAPLKELIRRIHVSGPTEGVYPRNIYGETPHTAMADQISELARLDNRT
jgi:hypothetical protein